MTQDSFAADEEESILDLFSEQAALCDGCSEGDSLQALASPLPKDQMRGERSCMPGPVV